MSGVIEQRLHSERVPDERLRVVWEAVYEGYTENWDQDALLDMAGVGEEVCSVLEELVELRATIARVEALPVKWRDEACPGRGDVNVMPDKTECADELDDALKRTP